MRYRITIALLAVGGLIMLCLHLGRQKSTDASFVGVAVSGSASTQSRGDQNSYGAELSQHDNSREMHVNYSSKLQDILGQVDPVERSIDFCSVLREWIDTDVEAALDFVKDCPRGNEYTSGIRIVLERVRENDPARAVALAGELVTEHDEMHVYNELFSRMVTNNPSDATRLLANVPEGEARINVLRAIASTWPDNDAESTFAWAVNLPAGERETALESFFVRQAENQPAAGIENASAVLGTERLKPIVERAALKWFDQDPQSAMQTIRKLPENTLSEPVVSEMIKALTGQSPRAALDWIEALQSPDTASLARRTFVTILSRNDPELAKEYLGQSN